MEEKILEIFYQEVVKEAMEGRIQIGDWFFNIGFSTKLGDCFLSQHKEEFETLEINNQESFQQKLIEYTNTLLNWFINYPDFKNCDSLYFDGNINLIIKNIVSSVWSNAMVDDFKNPEMYLQRCIDILNMDENTKNFSMESDFIPSLNNSRIICKVVPQNPANYESPYAFESQIVSEDGTYLLPSISFGVSNQICYMTGIQNKHKEIVTPYEKKINRLLYRVNKKVEDSYEEERIQDISSSQLISMVCFLKFLRIKNIQNVVANSYFPVRYHAKINAMKKKAKMANQEEMDLQLSTLYENIVNKFLRVLRRTTYHFPEITINSFPFELDSSTHITIGNELERDEDSLVYQINDSFSYLLNDKRK